MTSNLRIILVSPGAHYPSHLWPNTVALLREMRKKNYNASAIIFSSGTEAVPPDLRDVVEPVFARAPRFLEMAAAGKWQERRLMSRIMNAFETWVCLRKALAKTGDEPNAVLHFIGGFYWLVMLAALFSRRKFVHSLYGEFFSAGSRGWRAFTSPRLEKLIRRAVATGRLDFTCETELLRGQMAPLLGGHVHVVPYAIDDTIQLPSRAEARERLGLPAHEKIILFFGTHRREKDYRTALKGCLSLPDPPLALFVGKVISSNDPRQIVADCAYPKALVVDEFVADEKIKDYFAAADAAALPYEAEFSRGSGVLIECCRFLRPMIVSATPYFSPFLARYNCGVGYAPGDSASFAEAAARVLSNGEIFQPGLQQARREHSWNRVADQYLGLYTGKGESSSSSSSSSPPHRR
ncbi:MAG TPA: glycosyltransferase [Candidatus Sulfotelmatobacter sp.]|nr:glycosyltransferase [Candidatus Sulfotelmatobacter sp.]